MRLLVTGAAGMLGRAVVDAAEEGGHAVVAASRAELDVTDGAAVERRVREVAPDVVVNCAAYTDVDGAEDHVAAAAAVNAGGAGNVARTAQAAGAVLIHVSTDYVFDGRSQRAYVETDPTAPLSAYGRTKLAGERAVAEAEGRHAIARSSWLFGRGGRNFVDTMLRLGAEREELSVVDDQVGCPTWTGHLAHGLLALAASGAQGVHHVAAAGSCSWNELAREVFLQAGIECRVTPTTTEALARPAPRPANSVLVTARADSVRLPEWREGVRAHLAEVGALAVPTADEPAP